MLHTQPILRYYKPRSHYRPSICVAAAHSSEWFTLREYESAHDLLTAISSTMGYSTWEICAAVDLPHGAIAQWSLETMIDFDEVTKEFGEVAYAYVALSLDNDLNAISEKLFGEYENIADLVQEYTARYHTEFSDIDSAIERLGDRFNFGYLNGKVFVFHK